MFLAGSCFVLNMRLHPDQPISLKSSQVLPLFFSYFSLTGRKIQQWGEINHNVLYRPLGDVTRKRAVMTRGLALWKNGSWCHKANSL